MGRTEPSNTLPPLSARKDARAKLARFTLNKTIPALLSSNPQARDGVQKAELIVDPPGSMQSSDTSRTKVVEPSHHGKSKQRRGEAHMLRNLEDASPKSGIEVPAREIATVSSKQEVLRIRLLATDTLSAASLLYRETSSLVPKIRPQSRIGVLNMASPLRPGGGFLRGASAQEEYLCMSTTLLPALKEEFYRLPEVGGVFTPDVLVFRGAPALDSKDEPGKRGRGSGNVDVGGVKEFRDLAREERFYVDVLSAGMLRFPEVEERIGDDGQTETVYAAPKDLQLVIRKMKALIRIFEMKGVQRMVLGAWGCGAYGNPVGEVAKAWKNVLVDAVKKREGTDRENRAEIKEIIFAIRDRRMADDFALCWGGDLTVEDGGSRNGRKESVNDEEDSSEAKELGLRIKEVETQLSLAKTPMLKDGLEMVLKGLRNQLDHIDSTAGAIPDFEEDVMSDEDSEDG